MNIEKILGYMEVSEMKPVIIIPTLNPDHRLINLVEKLKKGNIPIVIINDGSKEECSDIFQKLKARFQCDILNHAKNIGKGAAIKTGIGYVSKVYPKNCGFITADGEIESHHLYLS
jgi:glycosyltransferase involved in cell wall biosynthesis